MATIDQIISSVVSLGSESKEYESKIRRLILFAGAILLGLIIVWKVTK